LGRSLEIAGKTRGGLPLVFVTVGTDHHPFDRLIEWVDAWRRDRGASVRCFMQTGTSRPPEWSEWQAYLSFGELQGLMEESTAVVCHGGPGTILDARRHGRVPIVVPRLRPLGEHVDDHQVRFSSWLDGQSQIALAEDEPHLRVILDQAVSGRGEFVIAREDPDNDLAVERFARLIDRLLAV